jgi:hypothetical protein
MWQAQDPRSILFITLDSCRYDTFCAADAPNLKRVGPLHRAMAPGNYTYSSHMAMFVGFTPGVAEVAEPFVNPKFAKIFKMAGPSFAGGGKHFMALQGRNIIDGLRRMGYRTIGTGAADWFDDRTETGRMLSQDFEQFWFAGNTWSLRRQVAWLAEKLGAAAPSPVTPSPGTPGEGGGEGAPPSAAGALTRPSPSVLGEGPPVFCFLNVGETHIPYYHEGAPWPLDAGPCVPFSPHNDAGECRRRQRLCLEFVDRELGPLLDAFAGSSIIVCGDHGDCWGEDGLWEHGFHHPKVLEVPMLFRLRRS